MSLKNFKKNEKPAHIVLLCHVLTIQVVKQDLDTLQQKNHVHNVISQTLSYEVKAEERWYEV